MAQPTLACYASMSITPRLCSNGQTCRRSTAGGTSDFFMCAHAWNCWLMAVRKVATDRKTSMGPGVQGDARRHKAAKGAAGMKTCKLLLVTTGRLLSSGAAVPNERWDTCQGCTQGKQSRAHLVNIVAELALCDGPRLLVMSLESSYL